MCFCRRAAYLIMMRLQSSSMLGTMTLLGQLSRLHKAFVSCDVATKLLFLLLQANEVTLHPLPKSVQLSFAKHR